MFIQTRLINDIQKSFDNLRKWTLLFRSYPFKVSARPNGALQFSCNTKYTQGDSVGQWIYLFTSYILLWYQAFYNCPTTVHRVVNSVIIYIYSFALFVIVFFHWKAKIITSLFNQMISFELRTSKLSQSADWTWKTNISVLFARFCVNLMTISFVTVCIGFGVSAVAFPNAPWGILTPEVAQCPFLDVTECQQLPWLVLTGWKCLVGVYSYNAWRIGGSHGELCMTFSLLSGCFSLYSQAKTVKRLSKLYFMELKVSLIFYAGFFHNFKQNVCPLVDRKECHSSYVPCSGNAVYCGNIQRPNEA